MTHAATSYRHNGPLGSGRPADVAIRGDGSRIYSSGTDGSVRVFHGDTGALLATWTVGTKLGGMDLSPDGSFLLVVEAEPVSTVASGQFIVAVHKVDTATGAVTTFLHQTSRGEWAFHDVSILNDGTALLTQKLLSGWTYDTYPEILNLQTGSFSTLPRALYGSSILTESAAGGLVLVAEGSFADASVRVYDQSSGFVAAHGSYAHGVSGYNFGVQAISSTANLVAQYVQSNGLHIYDTSLTYKQDLTDIHKSWIYSVAGLAFDPTGSFLFVLEAGTDRIYQLSTSDWSIVGSIAIGADINYVSGDFGNRLLIGPSMRYFTVVTDTGLLQIDNPAASGIIAGTEGDDVLEGTGLHDALQGLGGDDRLNGGGGDDDLAGGAGNDVYEVNSAGDLVVEAPGEGTDEVRTSLATYSLLGTQIENLAAGSDGPHDFRGSAGDNVISGGGGNDLLRLNDGGSDSAYGGGGNDLLYFGSALTGADVANGGDGRDALVLQGNIAAVLTDTSLAGIESISIQSGANSFFGDTANNFYDYGLTSADGNVAAGQQLIVNAQSLRVGEDFTFDGSAESDGRFVVYAGHGVDDLTGGDGADVFFFEGTRWGADDRVDGGGGRDSVAISAGSGLNRIEFGAESITGIESVSLNNFFASDPSQKPSYELVLHNGNVAPGGTLIVNGSSIPIGQVVNVDGSAVQNGNLILFAGGGHDVLTGGAGADLIFGGGGADALTGGAGADTFRYDATSDSSGGLHDLIGDFQTGRDRIDLSRIDANTGADGNQVFTWIGSNPFSGAAGELRLYESGGYQRIEGDSNGDGAADLLIVLQLGTAPLAQGDFLL